jgi:flagellar protein FlaJ
MENPEKYSELDYSLESSRLPITTPKLLSAAMFYSILSVVPGLILGYNLAQILPFESLSLPQFPTIEISTPVSFPSVKTGLGVDHIRLLFSILIALGIFALIRFAILSYPKYVALMRKGRIDATLPHTVNVMLGMAKGGVPLLTIFKFIAENRQIFEETSVEFAKIVEQVELMGKDLGTATLIVSRTTPSEKLRAFLENLINVYEGGGDIVDYLKTTSTRFLAEREKLYSVFFDILEIFAEVYLILFIVAPLFLLIVLVVFRMIQTGTLDVFKYIIYLFVPLGSVAMIYVLYLVFPREPGGIVRRYGIQEKFLARTTNIKPRFKIYEFRRKLNMIRNYILAPFSLPIYSLGLLEVAFYLVIPVIAYVILFLGKLSYDLFIFGLIVSAMIPAVIFAEYKSSVVRKMERALPDFLRQMAALNEAGLNVVESLRMLTEFEFGILAKELRKVKREVEWGELLTKALRKIEFRVRSPVFARVLSQVAKAMESTPSVSDALMTAAFYSEMEIEARDRVRAQMSVYTIIIYIAFGVFLFTSYIILHNIIGVFGGAQTQAFGVMFSVEEIKRAFFETTMIIGAFSGLVAGMMGEGKIEAGFKHLLILVSASFLFYKFIV